MRLNCYAEEMTDRIECITREAEGRKFFGLRFYLKTHEDLAPPKHGDDDSSAVTFWFLSHEQRREFIGLAHTAATRGVERAP